MFFLEDYMEIFSEACKNSVFLKVTENCASNNMTIFPPLLQNFHLCLLPLSAQQFYYTLLHLNCLKNVSERHINYIKI